MCDVLMWLGTSAPGMLLVLVVLTAVAAVLRHLSTVAVTCCAVIVSLSACLVLKGIIERPRPSGHDALVSAAGFSMPSTAQAMCTATSIAFVADALAGSRFRRLVMGVVGLANVVVGASLVYLGAHWLSDVLAGAIVGTFVALLVARAANLLRSGRTRPTASP